MNTPTLAVMYGLNGFTTTTEAVDLVLGVMQDMDPNYLASTDIGPCSPYRPSAAPCDCLRCQYGHITRVQHSTTNDGLRETLLFVR